MLTLASWLNAQPDLTQSEFARRLAKRLRRPVSSQNVHRWTREPSHAEFSIPEPRAVVAIYFETDRQVPVESWYGHLVGEEAAAAARAARAARDRQRARSRGRTRKAA
jgi:hypothetical protein